MDRGAGATDRPGRSSARAEEGRISTPRSRRPPPRRARPAPGGPPWLLGSSLLGRDCRRRLHQLKRRPAERIAVGEQRDVGEYLAVVAEREDPQVPQALGHLPLDQPDEPAQQGNDAERTVERVVDDEGREGEDVAEARLPAILALRRRDPEVYRVAAGLAGEAGEGV